MADVPTPATPVQLLQQAGQSIPEFQDPAMGDANARMAGWIEQIRQGASADQVFQQALHETHGPGHAIAQTPAPQQGRTVNVPVPPEYFTGQDMQGGSLVNLTNPQLSQAATGVAPPVQAPAPQPGNPSAQNIPAVAQSAIDPVSVPMTQGQAQGGVAPPSGAGMSQRHAIVAPDMGNTEWMRNPFMRASTAQSIHGTLNNMYNQSYAAAQRGDLEAAKQAGKRESDVEKARQFEEKEARLRAQAAQLNESNQKNRQLKWASLNMAASKHQADLTAKYGIKEAELIVQMYKLKVMQGISSQQAAARVAQAYLPMERDAAKRDAIMKRMSDGIDQMDQILKTQEPDVWVHLHAPEMPVERSGGRQLDPGEQGPVERPTVGEGMNTSSAATEEIGRAIGGAAVPPPATAPEPATSVFTKSTKSETKTEPRKPPEPAKTEQQKALEGASTQKVAPGGDATERKGDKTGKAVTYETPEQRVARRKAEKAAAAKGKEK